MIILQRFSGFLLIVVVAFICGLAVYLGNHNIAQAVAQLDKVQKVNLDIDKENRAMYRNIQSLRLGGQALEKLCRAELGLVRGDEIIYLLPKE